MRRKAVRRAAFQGENGAFSHIAARKLLGIAIRTVPCESFAEVFRMLATDAVTDAVIPIENTLHGSIHENYDNLLRFQIPIRGETSVRISHQLIAVPGIKFRQVKEVYSHPVALNQCRRFFAKYPNIKPKSFYDTAGSVRMIVREKCGDAAAIASETAAEIYGGAILKRNVEDNRANFTRFFLLSKQEPARSARRGHWKTSLVFATTNKAGALFRALACFALRDIDLLKIESRPLTGKPWEYLFYLDIAGKSENAEVGHALAHLAEATTFFTLLGTYKQTP